MIEPCLWDSEFFGFIVGRKTVAEDEDADYGALVEEARNTGVRLLYIFSEKPLENFPVKPADVKLIYSAEVDPSAAVLPQCEVLVRPEPKVYELAYRSGRHSRFFTDPMIDAGKFREMYRIWVDNSFSGDMGDKVFVRRVDGEIAGFVTLSLHSNSGSIGLIAVDEDFGRKGIGTALVKCCKRTLFDAGLLRLDVATQQANSEACAFYGKNGFVVSKTTYIYHLWI